MSMVYWLAPKDNKNKGPRDKASVFWPIDPLSIVLSAVEINIFGFNPPTIII